MFKIVNLHGVMCKHELFLYNAKFCCILYYCFKSLCYNLGYDIKLFNSLTENGVGKKTPKFVTQVLVVLERRNVPLSQVFVVKTLY
jgi:hypothetical protein